MLKFSPSSSAERENRNDSIVTPDVLTWHFVLFLLVDGAGEGVPQGDSSEEHFYADDEVLPACSHSAGTDLVSIDDESIGNDAAAFQDGQHHACKAETLQSQPARTAVYVMCELRHKPKNKDV